MTESVTDADELVRIDVLRGLLATTLDDDRWQAARAELITGGKSNLTFLVSSPAGEVILRRPPSGAILATAHDMGREARVQRALAGSAVPVAPVLLVDDGAAIGVPFYVMARVPGLVIRDTLPAGFAETTDQRRALGFALVDTLAALHAVEPAAVGLGDYGRPVGFVERQVTRWSRQWEASRETPIPAVDELARRLSRAVPAAVASGIVHGDYRLDNCIVDAADPGRINAVLDWELSTLGDPLTDVGLMLFYWHDAARLTPTIIQSVTTGEGFPSTDEIAQRWAERTGHSVDDLQWYYAFAHFKFAVITAGIHARVRAGAMSGQDFGDLTADIAATAESGLALAPA